METINVVTVRTGTSYGVEYLKKMRSMLERNLQMDMSFYCITDQPEDIDWFRITPPEVLVGWWNKLYLFSDLMPPGKLLYLDLDQIITGNITEIVQECLKHEFSVYSDHISWHDCELGTALMTFEAGSLTRIFEAFWPKRHELVDFEGGDQVWIAQTGLLPEVFYLDSVFPKAIASYKFDIVPSGKPPGDEVKIANCHGQPKPHQISKIKWVKQYWH